MNASKTKRTPRTLRPVAASQPDEAPASSERTSPAEAPAELSPAAIEDTAAPAGSAAPAAAEAAPGAAELMCALGNATDAFERALFLAATQILPGTQAEHAMFAARLAGLVAYATDRHSAGDLSVLQSLGKQVALAGAASKIRAEAPQWALITVVAQSTALAVAAFAASIARTVSVAAP